jgi:hypothetical protein
MRITRSMHPRGVSTMLWSVLPASSFWRPRQDRSQQTRRGGTWWPSSTVSACRLQVERTTRKRPNRPRPSRGGCRKSFPEHWVDHRGQTGGGRTRVVRRSEQFRKRDPAEPRLLRERTAGLPPRHQRRRHRVRGAPTIEALPGRSDLNDREVCNFPIAATATWAYPFPR